MSLPRFFDRAADASLPVLAELSRTAFRERLATLSVAIGVDKPLADDPASRAAYLLAVNLGARLYPRLILDGPADLRERGADLAVSINPVVDVAASGRVDGRWVWSRRTPRRAAVHATASGWNVGIDGSPVGPDRPEILAALAAAAIGMGEVFRAVFTAELGTRGRTGPMPLAFSLLTLGPPERGLPSLASAPAFGRSHLAGAGAVGEAAALTLREAGAVGMLNAVDPQRVDLGNLQRYLLAFDRHVGMSKVEVLAEQLTGSGITVEQVPTVWGADARTQAPAETVLAALDSIAGRIELQASLPRRIYNAYTQPLDIGWSRHEAFGDDACLACLYWPTGPRQHRHEIVGAALRQHPERVLRYLLVPDLVVGQPIPPQHLPPDIDSALRTRWAEVSIAQDVGEALFADPEALAARAGARVDDLYHDMCAGALLPTVAGDRDREVVVPLAHQSALAGIMLAAQLLAAEQPELAALRALQPQARFDVFRSLTPQRLPLARAPGCICSDPFYIKAYRARWQPTATVQA